MTKENRVKSLIKEAEIYGKQGLFKQSREKYITVLKLMEKNGKNPKNDEIINRLKNKIRKAGKMLKEVDSAPDAPELSEDIQDLISNLFSFSHTKEVAAIEGAVALAKFGQYEKAVASFQKLINKGSLPMMAAKNMLRCHFHLSSPETAVSQMNKWISQNTFSKSELKCLREFLENLLQKEGLEPDLIKQDNDTDTDEGIEKKTEDLFEISTIRIKLDSPVPEDGITDLDVIFQLGNSVSFIVKANEKKLLDFFKPGKRLSHIQCFSPISLFNANGLILKKEKITSGPKKGYYNFDLTIKSIETAAA